MYGVSAVEFAVPDRPDLYMAIRQSRRVTAEQRADIAWRMVTFRS